MKKPPSRGEGAGRPPYAPKEGEPQLVRILAANGVPHAIICQFLKIDVKTLKRHFMNELETGRASIVARLGLTVVQRALNGDNDMLKFWLKNRGGPEWQSTQQIELSGPNGTALQPPSLVIGFLPHPSEKADEDGGTPQEQ